MKVSIVGVGNVGSTLAFALLSQGLVDHLVLVARRLSHAEGEASDLRHSLAFLRHPAKVEAGELPLTAGSDIIVLTASCPSPEGEVDRLAMTAQNGRLFRELVPSLCAYSPEARLVIVSNPVDVLTYHALELSEFSKQRVMGTGTLVDSARFRSILAERIRIHPTDIRAYIFGEHGVTQFPALSLAQAAGTQIERSLGQQAFEDAVDGAYATLRAKGHTSYAVALATALVIEAIAQDSCVTMPLSTYIDGYLGVTDVCLSIPVVVGREGIVTRLQPELDAGEVAQFRRSAEHVRLAIQRLPAPDGGSRVSS